MNCSTPPIPGPCVSCKNPLEYLFELSYLATKGLNTRISFEEALDGLLDVGIKTSTCDYCCPQCGVYVLASVETFLKYGEALGFIPDCCSNLFASTETYLKFWEAVALTNLDVSGSCCDPRLDLCINKFLCWSSENANLNPKISFNGTFETILDKGIVEYGSFIDNCTNEVESGLCILMNFINNKPDFYINSSPGEFIDRILDKGISVVCLPTGEILIGSVETILKVLQDVS